MALEIQEWEIWHTYTTYVDSDGIDLEVTAGRLVKSGIAECAMLQEGRTYWRSGDKVESGLTTISIDAINGGAEFNLKLDEGCKTRPAGFALEAWGQAAYFRTGEHRVLGGSAALPPPYLRAFLGKCVLTSTSVSGESKELSLYPILIIYESGVMIVELRMIGPESDTTLENFIAGGVNLYKYKFASVEVNPGLAKFAARAYDEYASKWTFLRRLHISWLQAGHNIAVRQRTKKKVDDDFTFELAPWSDSQDDDLKSIALTICHTAAFFTRPAKSGLAFLLWGQPPPPLPGDFWSGRPHVHLVRFHKQCKTAGENEDRHGADFGRILNRATSMGDSAARDSLPKNGRLFDDYGAYILSTASLWVWSTGGLSALKASMDSNRGNLIYERQVLVELLEYGYMLHRSLYHRVEQFKTTADVVAVRKEIVQLRLKMREASHSGEIRKLLENGWNEFGLQDLIADTNTLLGLRESETRSSEALRATRVGFALTVVFGLVAVPQLADQVIKPAWNVMGLYRFTDLSVAGLIWVGIAFLLVVLFAFGAVMTVSSRVRAPKN
jgi:hypothetical protein